MNDFILLLRLRLRSSANALRFATRAEQVLIAIFGLAGVGIFAAILIAGIALLNIAYVTGGSDLLQNIGERITRFLFFFLLAGGIPFVASVLLAPGDLPLLAGAPVKPSIIVAARLYDAVLASSGQFIVIGLPLLIAVAVTANLPLGAWLLVPFLLILFTALPSLIIAALVLVVARLIGPRRLRLVVALASALLSLTLCLGAVNEFSRRAEKSGGINLTSVVDALAKQPPAPSFLPSTWMDNALNGLSRQSFSDSFFPILLLSLSTGIAAWIALLIGGRVLVGESILEGEQTTGAKSGGLNLNNLLRMLPISSPVRALIVKDARYVLRDLVLLSQIGIPLILYFVPFVMAGTARHIGASAEDVLALSLGIVATIVYMETSIFSLSSVGLEGRGFWLLLGAPVGAGRTVWAKWLSAFGASTLIGLPLFLVACLFFQANMLYILWGVPLLFCASAALCGLGVGLSGLFPRFIYENQAHRASLAALVWGFVGATVYVVLSGMLLGGGWFLAQQWQERAVLLEAGGGGLFVVWSLATGLTPLLLARTRLNLYAWEH